MFEALTCLFVDLVRVGPKTVGADLMVAAPDLGKDNDVVLPFLVACHEAPSRR